MPKPIIQVEKLSKLYDLGVVGATTFRDSMERRILNLLGQPDKTRKIGLKHRTIALDDPQAGPDPNSIWALKDISFTVERGEILGIIGRNGAGKSTLLKILSRITEPTEGKAVIRGRVSSLLEIGTGFHPELTGRDNIYLNGCILGMRKLEIDSKFDEIVAFSGIEKFLDTPVKRYSSGMFVRLAFAVAAHLEPEILFIDEVLSVGDFDFQQKCLRKIGEVSKEGRTIIFVSHSMNAIETICSRGIILSQGRVVFEGSQLDAIRCYIASSTERKITPIYLRKDHHGTGQILIQKIEITDLNNILLDHVYTGQSFKIRLYYEIKDSDCSYNSINCSVLLRDMAGGTIFCFRNFLYGRGYSVNEMKESRIIECTMFNFPVAPGEYFLSYFLIHGCEFIDGLHNVERLYVRLGPLFGKNIYPQPEDGTVLLDGEWKLC